MNKARILIVDDNPLNLEILGNLLSEEYDVSAAVNGFECLKIAASEDPPDLILLDIMMPHMDGYQVCHALQTQEQTRHIPIIFLTAVNSVESEEKGLAMGAVDYLTKPFSPPIILARVRTHLNLANRAHQLEAIVAQRTEELEQARIEAEQANLAKSQFLANMNHELRTPLNGIMGMTQLLMETELSQDQSEFMEDCYTSSSRLLDMVNDMLELSAADTGRIHLCPGPFNLSEEMHKISTLYGVQAAAKGLAFKISIDESLPNQLQADFCRIRQVLVNLLNNAIRYTDRGSITLSVEPAPTLADDSGGAELHFMIHNTGTGIPEERQSVLFEPFTIGEDFMTKARSGAGLGLSISKRIVNLLGGHIWLDKGEPGNTVFRFTVPCAP